MTLSEDIKIFIRCEMPNGNLLSCNENNSTSIDFDRLLFFLILSCHYSNKYRHFIMTSVYFYCNYYPQGTYRFGGLLASFGHETAYKNWF